MFRKGWFGRMKQRRQDLLQFFRFCIIGALNSGVSFLTYYVLIKLGLSMSISYVISYIAGMATSLWLNSKYTFAVKLLDWGITAKFMLANIIVLGIGEVILQLIVVSGVPVEFAQLVTLVATTVINFLLSRIWVFKSIRAVAAQR
jgi:putative flippase GtrA